MKHTSRLFFLMILIAFTVTSCFQEDPGPQMNDQKSFSVVDFDRLEASEALDITVQQGTIFSITATGDSRNLNDLDIHKNGSSLVMKFSAFDFPVEEVKIVVTGASHAKISPSQKLLVSVSGASGVLYRGSPVIEADVTGASSLGQD